MDVEPLRVGETLPARMTAKDMQRVFQLSSSRFYALRAIGRFDAFEIRPRIGQRAWSGKKVQAYLDGELTAVPRHAQHPTKAQGVRHFQKSERSEVAS